MTAGGSGRVVCVALNPALDITYVSERFVAGEANRVSRVHAQAGGKAVNVARLLRQAGHDVVVTGFVGGLVGDEIVGHLDGWAVPHCLVRCAAGSRRTVSAFSAEDAAATAYNESGPPIAAAEWERFADGFARLIHGAAGVVLSGSLPAGLPVDAYRTLAWRAADAGAAAFVDAHAAPLLAAIAAKPALVKPNEHELAEAAGLAVPVPLARRGCTRPASCSPTARRAWSSRWAPAACLACCQGCRCWRPRPRSGATRSEPAMLPSPRWSTDISRASHGRIGCAGRRRCPPRRCGSRSPGWYTLTMSPSWRPSSR